MTRLVVFNDPHYTRHPPERRGDNYPYEILDKFHEVARIAEKLGAETIACTGDWFHRKGKVTFREANDLLSILSGWKQKKGLTTVGILGNHDIAGHSLDSFDNRAVGSMVRSGALHLLDHEPYELEDMIISGTSYFHGCDADDDARAHMYGFKYGSMNRSDKVIVHLAHGTLLQKGSFFGDYTVAKDLIDLLHEHERLPDIIVCGHLHFSEGIKLYPRPGDPKRKVAVCRVGSLGRVSVDDFKRQPAALIVAVKDGKFVLREFPVGEPIEIAKHEPSEKDDEYQERIENFVSSLRAEADSWSVADHRDLLTEIAERMGHSEEVLNLAIKHVEQRQ